jgi:hypothetical protein
MTILRMARPWITLGVMLLPLLAAPEPTWAKG